MTSGPSHRPPTVTDATATTFMAERAAAEARRTSSRHLSKPTPQAHGPLLTKPERRQGPPAVSPPPYQPSMTAHIQRMPHYRRRRESPPNPEAETVRAHRRVHISVRPQSPRTPTEQDYEESPRPATATGPHDPVTPTHAHSSAQDCRPAQEQWWQRWTHTQLWELRKGARGEPSLEGLVHWPRKGSVENCRLQPAAGWMPQAAWEAMLADALHPLGVQPRNLPAPQDHPYVLRRLRETLQETQRDGIRLSDTPKAQPRTHTPPHHPTSVGAPTLATPTAPQVPCATHNTTRLTPRPAAPPSDPVTQQTTTRGRHARPRREVTKRTGRRQKPTHTTTSTTTPKGIEPRPANVATA